MYEVVLFHAARIAPAAVGWLISSSGGLILTRRLPKAQELVR
jgi:hypothetical protein